MPTDAIATDIPRDARRLVIAAAIALGVLADLLLRADSWRAGFVVWMVLALGAAAIVAVRIPSVDGGSRRERLALIAAAGVLATLLVLRDAPMLYAVDFLALVVVLLLVAWRTGDRPLAALEPRDALVGAASSVAAVVAGAPLLAARPQGPERAAERRRSLLGAAIGVIVAAPILLLVTSLLGEADPLFGSFVDEAGTVLERRLVGDLVFIAIAAWATAGALRGSLARVAIAPDAFRRELRLPFSTAIPAMGGLTVLLALWIGLQARTMFGGEAYLLDAAGLTVAEYARQGFFELIVIAGVVLATLLLLDDVLEREAGAARTSFAHLGSVLIALVGAVLASAVWRLGLYVQHHGLTSDRILALAVLVWVALTLGWFAFTVLRGARARFAPGVLVLSTVWVAALNLANPERRVVEVNVARAERGAAFDVAYHARLSADAVPALQRAADRLPPETAAALRRELGAVWTARASERADWRRWSVPFRGAVGGVTAAADGGAAPGGA